MNRRSKRREWRKFWAEDYVTRFAAGKKRPTVNRRTRRKMWKEEWRQRERED